jgi:DNA-binding NtrC family response regulator
LASDLPPLVAGDGDVPPAIDHDWPPLTELERRYFARVLDHTGGNKTEAAAILGIDRRTLQRMFPKDDSPDDDR